jgi:hypothetical protein
MRRSLPFSKSATRREDRHARSRRDHRNGILSLPHDLNDLKQSVGSAHSGFAADAMLSAGLG